MPGWPRERTHDRAPDCDGGCHPPRSIAVAAKRENSPIKRLGTSDKRVCTSQHSTRPFHDDPDCAGHRRVRLPRVVRDRRLCPERLEGTLLLRAPTPRRRAPLTRTLGQVKGTVRDVEKSQFLTARYTSKQLELVQVRDIVTGEGLGEALEGLDAVAHTASPSVAPPHLLGRVACGDDAGRALEPEQPILSFTDWTLRCRYALTVQDPLKDFIDPAVKGTLSVLKAAKVSQPRLSSHPFRSPPPADQLLTRVLGGRHQAGRGDFLLRCRYRHQQG